MIDRQRKEELVKELNESFGKAKATFLLEYRGITVEKITELRNSLREDSVDFRVVRNTLARLAVKGTDVELLKDHFEGPVAVAFSYKDAAAAAKTLTAFAKDEPKLKFRLATLGDKVLEAAEIKQLSELPTREELLGKVVGALNAVPTGLVGVLSALPRELVYVLKAIEDKKAQAA